MAFNNSANSAPAEWDFLLSSAQKNNAETILTLITKQGVDPNHANRISQSALHIASLWGHVESVETLLECGANPNVANTMTGATPLHCAVQSTKASSQERQVATIQALLDAGADASRGDFFGSTPLDYCQEGDTALAELLQVQVPPVFQSIDEQNVPQLESILQADSSVVQSRHESQTPLLRVVHKLVDEPHTCYLEMIQILLEHGANPNEQPTAHRNGHFAIQQDPGDAALYQICTALKANPGNDIFQTAALVLKQHDATVTPETQQLLHDAARRNQVDLCKFLIEKMEINVNTRGRQGMTPLVFAARSGKREMVEYLLNVEGIDVSIANDLGQTALDAASVNGKEDIVALLEHFANK